MHELSVIKNVVKILSGKQQELHIRKIRSVTLLVGEARLFDPKWVQMLFDMLTEDTSLQGTHIDMETVPATAQCPRCGNIFHYSPHHAGELRCLDCGWELCRILTGYELIIKNITVEEKNGSSGN